MNRYEKIEQIKETYRNDLPEPNPNWPPNVRRTLIFIIAHLFDPRLTVVWMKQQCHINGHNFAAVFAHWIGRTPKKYINKHRVVVAKKLLIHADLFNVTISTIALEVGFANVAAFSRLFKRKTGMTPGQWREIHGNR